MKMNNITLAKRIREEQEIIYRPYNVDVYLNYTDPKATTDENGIKHYPYDSRLEYTQGLNSNKSSKPIRKKQNTPVNKSILPLQSDEQLIWYNGKNFHNNCSFYVDDSRTDPNSLFDFYITITPKFETNSTEQDLLNLTKICFRNAQKYINPKNKHRINDVSTVPNVEINVCKEYNTYVHLHIVIRAMCVRDFKVLIYFLFNIYRSKFPYADIEYHNLICTETNDDYNEYQIIRTLFTKDIFDIKTM